METIPDLYAKRQSSRSVKNTSSQHDTMHHASHGGDVSFGAQKIDLSDYIIAPEGYEGLFYCVYALFIPYTAGALFLFFFIADGVYAHFKLLDLSLNSFLIIWMIGYEVLAAITLTVIFISFLRYRKRRTII